MKMASWNKKESNVWETRLKYSEIGIFRHRTRYPSIVLSPFPKVAPLRVCHKAIKSLYAPMNRSSSNFFLRFFFPPTILFLFSLFQTRGGNRRPQCVLPKKRNNFHQGAKKDSVLMMAGSHFSCSPPSFFFFWKIIPMHPSLVLADELLF